MHEKPPKDPTKKSQVFDFKTGKIIPNPQETLESKLPEITVEEAKKIFQEIFDDFEPRVWRLHGLVKKARDKFDAYEHLATSGEYSEGHYRAFVSQKKPHRIGSKVGREKEISRIFTEDETRLYGKIHEYEREFKDYIQNFLREREGFDHELHNACAHLRNVKGAEELKEELEKYLKKMDFNFTSFAFIQESPEGYREKIEIMEKFAEKLVNE